MTGTIPAMRMIRTAIAGILALSAVATASAQTPQFPQTLPANTVWGRLGISAGPPQAIPFAALLPNISFLQNGSGAVPQTISAIFQQTTLATEFGVKCDGTTDDLASINKAVLAASQALVPTRILFPKGTCRITGTVVIASSYILLQGQGPGQTTIYRDFTTGPDISIVAPSNNVIVYNGVQGFTFTRNMALTPAASDVALVKCTACDNFYFRDNTADNVVEGLQLIGGAFFYIERSVLVGQYAAVGQSRFGLKAELLASPGAGATIRPSYLWMNSTYFSGPLNGGFGYALWITSAENWNISQSYFGQAKFHNILIEQGTDNSNILDVQVNNSYIDSAGANGISITGSGVASGETWTGIARSGGNGSTPIQHIALNQVMINGNGSGAQNGIIVNGTARGGTFSQALNNFNIAHCNIVSWLGSGVRIDGGNDVVLTGNTIRGNNYSNSSGGVGVVVSANASSVIITGNRIGGDSNGNNTNAFQAAGINVIAGASNYTIANNDLRLNAGGPIAYGSTNGIAFGNSDGSNTLIASVPITLNGATSGGTKVQALAAASGTLTLPSATDTLVGKATTDTLTNKSISGATNTITALPLTTGVTGVLPFANGGVSQGAWTSYTPTVGSQTGTITTSSATGQYQLIAQKTACFQFSVTITTNGTGATAVTATLPVTAANTSFAFTGRANGVSGKLLIGYNSVAGAGTVTMTNYDATYPGSNGEVLVMSGCYQTT